MNFGWRKECKMRQIFYQHLSWGGTKVGELVDWKIQGALDTVRRVVVAAEEIQNVISPMSVQLARDEDCEKSRLS
eukprot:scaffold1695_cov167-Amphora_coffeaeformis.AAC.31